MKKNALIVVSLMVFAKFLGFVKNIFLARFFGTEIIADSYQMAIAIPTILLGAVLYSQQAFTPGYFKTSDNSIEKRNYINTFINFISIISVVICLLILILGKHLIPLFAPGFDSAAIEYTYSFLTPIVIGTAFLGLANIFSEYLRCNESFITPQILYLVINIVEIFTLFFAAYFNILWLSYGYLLANFLYFFLVIVFSYKKGFKYKLCLNKNSIQLFIKILIPVLISCMLVDINSMVDKMFASFYNNGVISALGYAINIRSVCLIAASGYITVLYPKLAKLYTNEQYNDFNVLIKKSLIIGSIVYVPASILLFFLSRFVTMIVYFRGSFNEESLDLTSLCVAMYALGMASITIRDIFIKALYCMKCGKMIIITSLINVVLNVGLNFLLTKFLGYSGIPLATSISATCMIPILFIFYKKKLNSMNVNKEC